MSDKEILKKAIEKAVKNGWKPIELKENETIGDIRTNENGATFYKRKKYSRKPKFEPSMRIGIGIGLKDIILSHDFPKALFGNKIRKTFEVRNDKWHENVIEWKYHLQQMVILSDNEKFKYLKKFL